MHKMKSVILRNKIVIMLNLWHGPQKFLILLHVNIVDSFTKGMQGADAVESNFQHSCHTVHGENEAPEGLPAGLTRFPVSPPSKLLVMTPKL